ncbi:uncharacterized protein LOC120263797 [Dioscorea cayenensis subsp. rotundata]|uniref:Uncharacterized protein LOC120263797 n=1 Tax=Dioscorea cayennensis subsp. rotundata TaxID=55577 RepID=A0AB40BMH7_DIOCR|nr:uncharacterized protein LOC120263797 [Dioscorea cayenensis subsp. rotundata]
MFGNIEEGLHEEEDLELEDHTNDIPTNNEDNGNGSPATTAVRPQRPPRRGNGNVQVDGNSMTDLISAVNRMVGAIENPSPMTTLIYKRVHEVDGFDSNILDVVFEYLDDNERQGRKFIEKTLDMRKAWIERFVSSHMA